MKVTLKDKVVVVTGAEAASAAPSVRVAKEGGGLHFAAATT